MKNKQNMPDLIVSVESRKGGVGKTTAALCLARLLRKKGYAVLLLDLDVTGTDAADIANSPFWERDLHVIGETNEKDNYNRPLNLIGLFDQRFMAGLLIPEFSTQSSSSETMYIDLSKVNILGSQIYKTNKDNGNGKGATCIERPGILFDDLHTIWLLELVKHVIANFVGVARRNNFAKHAIILDNSPGFVGISPAIHEWLTDRGPISGKFLMVTSLDRQDISACDRAINDLHGLYTSKWQTSRLFMNGDNEGSGINVEKDQETFFVRLASSVNGCGEEVDPLDFYKNVNQSTSKQQKGNGQRFCDYPEKYIATIFNRVPRAVKAGNLTYEYEYHQVTSQGRGIFGRLLRGKDDEQRWRGRMISYDEYIENQFLLKLFHRGRVRKERHMHRLIEALKMAEEELRIGINENSEDSIRLLRIDFKHLKQLKAELVKANNIVSRAREAVEDAGLGHLARLIHDEWLPGSIVPNFRSALSKLLRKSDFPYIGMRPLEVDSDSVNSDEPKFLAEFKTRILMELRQSNAQMVEYENNPTVNELLDVLSGLVGLSLISSFWRSPVWEEISELLAGVFAIELKHWGKRGEGNIRKVGLQRFLAQESVTQVELRKDMEMFKPLPLFRHAILDEEESSFVDFYKACASSQARLIDFSADSRFLIQLLRFIVEGEIKRGELFPFVKDIAEDVIINKSLSHEEAPARMAKALQTAEYFREFDKVLSDILDVWEVSCE